MLAILPGDFYLNNRLSAYSAQPASETCGTDNLPTGQRASLQSQRICPDGHILQRNTIRRDNAFFSWDIRLSRPFNFGRQGTFEAIFEVFNVTNSDNFKDPVVGWHVPQFRRHHPERPRRAAAVPGGGRWLF